MNKPILQVKFLPENGDAKIDIGSVKKSLSGLGKAELMKYANDPFWIRLRWLLFIIFWALWATMLVGAIAIIVMAPKKCTNVWKESLIARMDAKDEDTSTLWKMEKQLERLKELKFRVVSLNSVLEGTKDGLFIFIYFFFYLKVNFIMKLNIMNSFLGATKNFMNIDPKVGQLNDFIRFVESANKNGIDVILEINPNYSSDQHPWFENSLKKVEPYSSYYIWKSGKENLAPPNNWVTGNTFKILSTLF